jgi:hypothetical protein
MHHVVRPRILMDPLSLEEQRLIRDELAEVLKSRHFCNSRRYPALLSYVVRKTLAGQAEELKERVLGVEVFHRPPDYDSDIDTVVRVAAGEVRRRLALIYYESDGEHAIEISLPTGSYVPEFYRNAQEVPAPSVASGPALPHRIPPASFPKPLPALVLDPYRSAWGKKIAARIAFTILIASLVALSFQHRTEARQNAIDLFWQPIRSSSSPAIFCPGAMVKDPKSTYGLTMAQRTDDYTFTSMATTMAVADLVHLFSETHTEYLVQPTSTITLTDIRQHPAVLIGAYNNEWTLNLQKDLRYRFADDPARQIYDVTNSSVRWSRPQSSPYLERDDFAIVARFYSKITDSPVVMIAGIEKNGTQEAAEFVSTPRYMDALTQQAKDWASKNVEMVLKIKVVHGKSGVPSIEAVQLW